MLSAKKYISGYPVIMNRVELARAVDEGWASVTPGLIMLCAVKCAWSWWKTSTVMLWKEKVCKQFILISLLLILLEQGLSHLGQNCKSLGRAGGCLLSYGGIARHN
jgi:hypothetical protein